MKNPPRLIDGSRSSKILGWTLVLAMGHVGAATLSVAPSGADSGNCTTGACATVGYALGQAADGDIIQLAAGTYVEQLTVDKSVTIAGVNPDRSTDLTVIQAPATLATNVDVPGYAASQQTAIVFVTDSGTDATIRNLTIRGHQSATGSYIGWGVFAGNSAKLTLDTVHVTAIRDQPLSGSQHGRAIGFGIDGSISLGNLSGSQTATGAVTDSLIDDFQKNGIEVGYAGTNVTLRGNTVTGIVTDKIAQNGIVIADGAYALVDRNTISGMQCNQSLCEGGGGNAWSIGLTLIDPADGTQITHNTISGADGGVVVLDYGPAAPTITMTSNTLSDARYANLQVWGPMTLNMVGNTLSGSVDGIQAYVFRNSPVVNLNGGNTVTGASDTGIVVYGATVQGSKNRFFGNGTGAVNVASRGGTANLTCNWWGSFTGPEQTSTNPGGLGNAVSDDVSYVNWAVDAQFNHGCVGNPEWVRKNPKGPLPTPVPVDAPWALASVALVLAGLAGRRLRRRRGR